MEVLWIEESDESEREEGHQQETHYCEEGGLSYDGRLLGGMVVVVLDELNSEDDEHKEEVNHPVKAMRPGEGKSSIVLEIKQVEGACPRYCEEEMEKRFVDSQEY